MFPASFFRIIDDGLVESDILASRIPHGPGLTKPLKSGSLSGSRPRFNGKLMPFQKTVEAMPLFIGRSHQALQK
jgi:hypothetical protein